MRERTTGVLRPKSAAVRRRTSRKRGSAQSRMRGATSVLVLLVVWEAIARLDLVSESFFPSLVEIAEEFGEQLATSGFWLAVGRTLQGWTLGLALSLLIAVPLGIAIGSSWFAWRALRPIIEFVRPIPVVALIPLALLVIGHNQTMKVVLIMIPVSLVILIHTIYGVQDVDPVASDTARSFGFGRLPRLIWVTLPSTTPYIATGLRVSAAIALVLSVSIELLSAIPGLGNTVNVAMQSANVPLLYAMTIATGMLGWTLNRAIHEVERRLFRWHPGHRESPS